MRTERYLWKVTLDTVDGQITVPCFTEKRSLADVQDAVDSDSTYRKAGFILGAEFIGSIAEGQRIGYYLRRGKQ